jgi:predicted nucleic acid-binding protein
MRIYLDTNVYGYAVDVTKGSLHRVSLDVLQMVRDRQHELIVSDVLRAEITEGAPEAVRTLFAEVRALAIEEVVTTERATRLADAYITAQAIGASHYNDALHIAFATIAQCGALLSWDVTHIVTDWRVERYNSVNRRGKYRNLAIQTPAKFVQRRGRKR